MDAATESQSQVLANTMQQDRDLRSAVFLAANLLPATVVQGRLGVRAVRGMVKLAYLSDKGGGLAAKMYPKVQVILESRMQRENASA